MSRKIFIKKKGHWADSYRHNTLQTVPHKILEVTPEGTAYELEDADYKKVIRVPKYNPTWRLDQCP